MIPKFPEFKKFEPSDRADIEKFTKKFPPYSDFNFTSLWCWDIHGQMRISELNNNLAVKFTDYLTGEPFYTFVGINTVNQTISELFRLAETEGIVKELRLIPEETASLVDHRKFNVKEDIDNFDYILSTESLKTYRGNKLGPKRNFVNRFKKKYVSSTHILDFSDSGIQAKIGETIFAWACHKRLIELKVSNEFRAISRIFAISHPSIIGIGIFVGEKLAAFSINEVVNHDYAILHFEKGDLDSYVGLFPFLMQESARVLSDLGISLLNYEQDMGILGLRQSKTSYHPVQYLKQYILSPR